MALKQVYNLSSGVGCFFRSEALNEVCMLVALRSTAKYFS